MCAVRKRSTTRLFKRWLVIRPSMAELFSMPSKVGTLLAKEAEAYLRERGFPVFTARLHQYIAFREAIGRGLTVREYEPAGKAARDLAQVYDELQEYCNGNQKA